MSERTFRSISMPAFLSPCMNTEYDIPCRCAPALMRTIHSLRKSRFLFLRSRYAYFQPRSTFSFAAFHSLLRAPKAPRAAFITCFLRFKRATFDLTCGICLFLYAWSRRLMFFVSPGVRIIVPFRRWRFLFGDFLVRMSLLNALMPLTLPGPVILKRFRAPLCDFIFGMLFPDLCRANLRDYFGARIIVMNFPSNFGSASILATSASS